MTQPKLFNESLLGDSIIIPGVAGKVITVTKLALGAVQPVNVTPKGGSAIAVQVQAAEYDAQCPIVCAAGVDFVLTADAGTSYSGVVFYSQE